MGIWVDGCYRTNFKLLINMKLAITITLVFCFIFFVSGCIKNNNLSIEQKNTLAEESRQASNLQQKEMQESANGTYSEWKIYTNKEYRYTFRYPSGYNVEDTKNTSQEKRKSVRIISPKTFPHPVYPEKFISHEIIILTNTFDSIGSTIDEIKRLKSGNSWGREEILTIDGKMALLLEDFNNADDRLYIIGEDEVYEIINYSTETKTIFEGLYNTFKII